MYFSHCVQFNSKGVSECDRLGFQVVTPTQTSAQIYRSIDFYTFLWWRFAFPIFFLRLEGHMPADTYKWPKIFIVYTRH